MIRQITGELSPTSGEISVLGRDVVRRPLEAKALMGVVPQDGELYPVMKPAEQMVSFGRLHGMGRREAARRAEELMNRLDLQPHRDKLNRHLSGGLQRKVLIGTALIANPEILVLDEPTTGLDPRSRREVWEMLRAVRRDGKTLLITTHYMDEAEALSDVITMVAGGRIIAEGSLEELRSRYGHRFKASFTDEAGEACTVYGAEQEAVVREMERAGVTEYALSRTSLEDLYLQLTSEESMAIA
jgi:ABC-2 type transport system ATP-binding protein